MLEEVRTVVRSATGAAKGRKERSYKYKRTAWNITATTPSKVGSGELVTDAALDIEAAVPLQSILKPSSSKPVPIANMGGKRLYESVCVACHGAGVAGAPRFGDKLAWADRIKRGNEVLHEHAIKGFQGRAGMMPPKGGAMANDDEVRAAVDYMIAAVK